MGPPVGGWRPHAGGASIASVPAPVCQSCAGPRGVQRIERLGVEMLLCRYCLADMGLSPDYAKQAAQAEAQRQPEPADQSFLELLVNRPADLAVAPLRFATEGRPARCKDCGADMLWFPTTGGRWLAVDPEVVETRAVAPNDRCYVDSDGIVHSMASKRLAQSRVPHRIVCASRPAPTWPPLKALWDRNRF